MHNPPHPGEVLLETYMKPLGLNLKQVSDALGVTRTAVQRIVKGDMPVSIKMAHRLAIAFGGDPRTWLNLRLEYDIWFYRKHAKELNVKTLYCPTEEELPDTPS